MAASSKAPRKSTRSSTKAESTSSKKKKTTIAKTRHGREANKSQSSSEDERDEDYEELEDVKDIDESEDENGYDSDAIDEDEFVVGTKRKRGASGSPRKKARTSTSPKKKTSKRTTRSGGNEVVEDSLELEDGQEVVGVVVQAPTTGQVPPGQVSKNTFDFLTRLKDPKCNDRTWFKLHEPVYRQAENEWKAFVEAVTKQISEADPHVPPLPPKDLIHRIYRDIRFSNDKTPYKKNFSASFSRSGRKGIWAGYHVSIQPDGKSIVAAGSWCPARNELANIRANLQRQAGADRLRQTISDPEFVSYFGEPHPAKDGSRQNIFGADDELKVAPKGVDKSHRDLDLLKCRSFAVVHRFTDSEALQDDFAEKVGQVVQIMRPFVHCINDLMTVVDGDSDEEDN